MTRPPSGWRRSSRHSPDAIPVPATWRAASPRGTPGAERLFGWTASRSDRQLRAAHGPGGLRLGGRRLSPAFMEGRGVQDYETEAQRSDGNRGPRSRSASARCGTGHGSRLWIYVDRARHHRPGAHGGDAGPSCRADRAQRRRDRRGRRRRADRFVEPRCPRDPLRLQRARGARPARRDPGARAPTGDGALPASVMAGEVDPARDDPPAPRRVRAHRSPARSRRSATAPGVVTGAVGVSRDVTLERRAQARAAGGPGPLPGRVRACADRDGAGQRRRPQRSSRPTARCSEMMGYDGSQITRLQTRRALSPRRARGPAPEARTGCATGEPSHIDDEARYVHREGHDRARAGPGRDRRARDGERYLIAAGRRHHRPQALRVTAPPPLAEHDPMTGLVNRRSFAELALKRSRRPRWSATVPPVPPARARPGPLQADQRHARATRRARADRVVGPTVVRNRLRATDVGRAARRRRVRG